MVTALGCSSSTTPAFDPGCATPDDPGCVVASSTQQRVEAAAPLADVEAVVQGNTAFALDLYRQLAALPGNLFFSPFSVSESLATLWAGARGATEQQMAKALRLSLPQSRLHSAFSVLDRALAGRGEGADGDGFHLTIASALWAQQGYPIASRFLDTVTLDHGAGLGVVDFLGAPERARDAMNHWVAERSDERIDELFAPGSITSTTRLVVGDAVYFKAAWKTPFDPANSRFAKFTRRDGSSVVVPTMAATQSLNYGEGPGYTALQLPYADGDLSMVLLLPTQGTVDALATSLTADRLASILDGLDRRTVTLTLPCFKIASSLGLQEPLARLGMRAAFTDGADFSGIDGRGDLALSAVVHQAFVDVDEAGTEAAASTATTITTTAAAMPAEVRFEHPYLFLIRDDATGTLLFLGRVDDPSR